MGLLDGRVAIVTGAGQGLGRAHALELARQGAQLVINDLGGTRDGEGSDTTPAQQVVDEIEAIGAAAVANYDDVSDWSGAEQLVNQAVETYGQLDVLVNNAGILRDTMSFNMSEDEWDAVVRVHLKGHFAPAHFAAVHWRTLSKAGEAVSGRIINTSSESGLFGNAGQANYAAAKSGIWAMSLVMARELQRYGVTVNCLAPRARTRMTVDIMGEGGEAAWDELAPENVSPLVAWLASDAAANVSGQLFIVWGDEIQLCQPVTTVGTIKADGRAWTPEELVDATKELFAGRESGVPAFGVQPA